MPTKPQTTPITLDDWLATLPVSVREHLVSKLSAAQKMATAIEDMRFATRPLIDALEEWNSAHD